MHHFIKVAMLQFRGRENLAALAAVSGKGNEVKISPGEEFNSNSEWARVVIHHSHSPACGSAVVGHQLATRSPI